MIKCYCGHDLNLKYKIRNDKLYTYGTCQKCKLTIRLDTKETLEKIYKKTFKNTCKTQENSI